MRNIYAFLFFKSSYIPFFASHIKGYLFCCRYHPKTVIHHLQSEKCIYNLWEFVDDRKLNRRFREMSFSNICKGYTYSWLCLLDYVAVAVWQKIQNNLYNTIIIINTSHSNRKEQDIYILQKIYIALFPRKICIDKYDWHPRTDT